MVEVPYVLFHNLDAGFRRIYQPGDRLVRGFSGVVAVDVGDPVVAAEKVWVRHNRDDRPDGLCAPSLSIGDVVVLGEVAFGVAFLGFTEVTVVPGDVLPVTWLEAVQGQ